MKVFQAYVVGGEGEYDDVLALTLPGARAAAAEEFKDYFGDPIAWKDPQGNGTYQSGMFYAQPHRHRTILICEREVQER